MYYKEYISKMASSQTSADTMRQVQVVRDELPRVEASAADTKHILSSSKYANLALDLLYPQQGIWYVLRSREPGSL